MIKYCTKLRNKIAYHYHNVVIVPCFAHQYSKGYVMDVIVY